MSFLLDTNVLSEARKPSGDAHVRTWLASVPDASLYVSVLAIGEIRQDIDRLERRDPAQAMVLNTWMALLLHDNADRILPVTRAIAEAWGQLNVPDPLPVNDGLLAATALVHKLTLVTRNTADVARTGIGLLNPFLAPR